MVKTPVNLKQEIYKEFQDLEILARFFKDRNMNNLNNQISARFVQGGPTLSFDDGNGSTYTVYEFVHKTSKEKVYIRFDGTYSSYEGLVPTHWDFVAPKEVTEIRFEKE